MRPPPRGAAAERGGAGQGGAGWERGGARARVLCGSTQQQAANPCGAPPPHTYKLPSLRIPPSPPPPPP